MKQKGIGILVFLAVMSTCLTFGAIGCGKKSADTSTSSSSSVEDEGRKNPRIMVETDELEFAVEVGERYTMPYAGVYYENLDRVDDAEVRMSVIYSWYDEAEGAFVDPYVEIEDTIDNQLLLFADAGKYEIVYKSEGCADVVVTIYACERLPSPKNFQVDLATGKITWDKVEGASGYTVTVNGDTEVDVTEESFTSDIFSQDGFYVGVTAKGDNKIWLDSYLGSYQKRLALQDGELAAFNNPCYELDITNYTGKINPDPSEIEWLTEEDCAGSTDGALKVRLKAGDSGWSVFKVALQKKIDLPVEGGVEVRFKLDTTDYLSNDENLSTLFAFSGVTKHTNNPKDGIYMNPAYNDEWQVLRLDALRLNSYLDQEHFHFNLYDLTRGSGKGDLYLDYIRVYESALETPELTVEEGKLTWAAQENVREYMVEADVLQADGTRVQKLHYVTANEISFADMGITETSQYDVRVRAVSSVATVGSSAWSEWESKRTLTDNYLTKLDSALYEKDADENAVKASSNKQRIYYTNSSGAEGGSALRVVLRQDYNNTSSHFQLKLTEGINLAKAADYQGILVRFKVDFVKLDNTSGLRLQYVGNNGGNDTGSLYSKRIMETGKWYDLQLPFENLEDLYEDGDKTLYFAVLSDKSQEGMRIAIDIDYVTYYKALTAPTNVRIDKENNKLVWDAVDGASGYTVSVNGDERFVETTEFDLSLVTEDAILTVRTESDEEGFASSLDSTSCAVHVFVGKQVATFNHVSYADDVVAGNPNATVTSGVLSAGFRPTREPKYDAALGNDGAVDFNIYSGDIGGGKLHAFTVQLYKPLDLTTYDEISIRFAVPSISGNNLQKAYFSLLHATDVANASYTTAPTANSATAIGFTIDETNIQYYTLILSKAALNEMGYDTGATAITLGVWSSVSTNKGALQASARVYLDDISYSNVLDIPTVVAVSDTGLVTWNAVENADGYIVSVNGEEFAVTTNSYQHADLGADANFKVRATSTNTDYDPSLWSVTVSYVAPRLDEPTEVTVSSTGLVEWTAVAEADGYVVEINGTEYETATNSYQLTSLTADAIVKVRATSEGEWMDSEWSAEAYYYALGENELATFNTAAYVSTVSGVEGYKWTGKYRTAPFCEGGTVKVGLYLDNYTPENTSTNLSAVKINLPKGLDLTKDSIVVNFQVYDKSGACYPTNFTLLKKGDNANWNSTDKTTLPGVAVTFQKDQALAITSAQLTEMGYVTGDTELYFGIWERTAMSIQVSYGMWVRFDNIAYGELLTAPANVAVSETGLVTWDTVENADGYIVSVNGEEVAVTTNSYQFPALGANATVKVRATSRNSYWVTSDWSAEANFVAPTLNAPANVAVSSAGVVTWDEVDGAEGYIVSVNGNEFTVEENSYQLTELLEDAVIKVLATTTNKDLANSPWSAEANYEAPRLDVPANVAVTDAGVVTWDAVDGADGYTVSVNGNTVEVEENTYQLTELTADAVIKVLATTTNTSLASSLWSTEVKYYAPTDALADFANANRGTISGLTGFVKGDGYRTAPFYEDGTMKAGFYPDRYHAAGGSTELAAFKVTLAKGLDLTEGGIVVKVQLYDKSGAVTPDKFTLLTKDGQSTWQSGSSADFPGVALTYQEWLEVKFSSAELQSLGYATGDTVLYFGGWIASLQASLGTGLWFQLDDISHYEAEGGVVENPVIADFSDADNGTLSGLEGFVHTDTPYRTEPFYEADTLKAGIRLDRYHAAGGSTKLAAFKVTLPTGLDLSKDGIAVKVQIYDKSGVLTFDKFTLLTKDGQSSWQSGSSADFIGVAMTYQEWMEVKLSSADLQAMGYATGDTELYFGGWVTNDNLQASTNTGLWFQLDEISYYTEA
ncbi:MAG: hypothetical protein IJZ32_05345 [Clostridia bacterium]|nr:hypothetical protein [Clostridia bacterium]